MHNNTVTLHRVFKAAPEKVFRAFSDPGAMASWFPHYGFVCTIQSLDFRVGGKYAMTFTNFTSGKGHSFGGTYKEIRDNEFLELTDQFDDPNLPGQMITSIQFKEVMCGTELSITQSGIPAMIPLEMCYLGWQDSLDKLMRLVEPNIPEA